MSEDYGPALWRPANTHNYTPASAAPPWDRKRIDRIVVHVSGGSADSAYNTFLDRNRQASYHYLVDFDTDVYQFVREKDTAWHAGYWPMNARSVGVGLAGSLEHNRDKTEQMYLSLARLLAHLSRRYGMSLYREDRDVIGHYQVPGCSGEGGGFSCHSDPGEDFRWRLLLRAARRML